MKKYVIKFSNVEERKYTAVVEAKTYEEAMNVFEKSPFAYTEREEPESREIVDWNVSKVTNGDKVEYENSRKLKTKYSSIE